MSSGVVVSPPEVVFHHLHQARASLRMARSHGVRIQLKSAPGAAAFAGVGFFQALGETVGHDILIDCDEDAGLAMAALRSGCRMIAFAGPSAVRTRLDQMAKRSGASLLGPDRSPASSLTLSPDDNEAAIEAWFDQQTRG